MAKFVKTRPKPRRLSVHHLSSLFLLTPFAMAGLVASGEYLPISSVFAWEGEKDVAVDEAAMAAVAPTADQIAWFEDHVGKITYSQEMRMTEGYADCSSAVTMAVLGGRDKVVSPYEAYSTETLHKFLLSAGYQKVVETEWGSNEEIGNRQAGDIFIWGTKGHSAGNLGHTGLFVDEETIMDCRGRTAPNDAIQKQNYEEYKSWADDHGTVYIYSKDPKAERSKLKNPGLIAQANSELANSTQQLYTMDEVKA